MLTGQRVLVVEDELLIADVLTSMLEELNAVAIELESDLPGALAAAHTTSASVALVDMNLGDDSAWPVIDVLLAREIRVLVMSGDGEVTSTPGRAGLTLLRKPYGYDELAAQLAAVLA